MTEKVKCDLCGKERLVVGFLDDKRIICMKCYKANQQVFRYKLKALRNSDGEINEV